jgi:hypothetical protein
MEADHRPTQKRFRVGFIQAVAPALALLGWLAPPSRACDLCAIYTTTEGPKTHVGPEIAVGEQYTHFGTLQLDGERVTNPADEFLDSSITQILLGYRIVPRFGLRLVLPIISRTFRRATAHGAQRGDESGPGDLSLIGDVNLYEWGDLSSILQLSAFGGLKLPSGDSSRLKEESEEVASLPVGVYPERARVREGSQESVPRPNHETGEHEVASGVHGHDLALGSGSVDGILGAQAFFSWYKLFFSGSVQYLLRTEGDFHYRYANELLWQAGPGLFALSGHAETIGSYTLALQAVLSGESKGRDTSHGEKAGDTSITALYIGPRVSLGLGSSFSADLGGELPVLQNNSELQIVPDYRLRGGITWRC